MLLYADEAVEAALKRLGFDSAGRVFAPETLVPPRAFERLLLAAKQNKLLGAAALIVPNTVVSVWSEPLRVLLGKILQLCPSIVAWNALSKHNLLHFGLDSVLGEHPLWLTQPPFPSAGAPAVHSISAAVVHALAGLPFQLVPQNDLDHLHDDYKYGRAAPSHPLAQFAERYDCFAAFDAPYTMPAERVAQARAEAEETLAAMARAAQPAADPIAALDAVLGAAPRQQPRIPRTDAARPPRRLELGTVFDPKTHYTDEYYDGTGLEYCSPAGEWVRYQGTGLAWDRNEDVIGIIRRHTPAQGWPWLDVGCSAGDFVAKARAVGLKAYGVDISERAIARAQKGVQPYLLVGDVVKGGPGLARLAPFQVITAWDLFEHIYLEDVESLICGLVQLLAPDGKLWANICTRGDGEQDWTIKPGTTFTQENSWLLCSGHVTIRTWSWWMETFAKCGLQPCSAVMKLVDVAKASSPRLAGATSWTPRNLLVLRRKEGKQ